MEPSRHLNLVGLKCPSPIVELNRAIKSMVAGEALTATADDPAFQLDVQAWCKRTGHLLVQLEQNSGKLTALIKKAGA